MNRCRRCGKNLEDTKKLWCSKCVELVKADLRWEIDNPLKFYFKDYYKRRGKEEKQLPRFSDFGGYYLDK